MERARQKRKYKMTGPTIFVRTGVSLHRDMKHLAKRYTDGNISEMIRQLVREEMAREIQRGKQ